MGVKDCCCSSLRTGTIIIGSFFLIIGVIHFIVSVVYMNTSSDSQILQSESGEDYSQDDLKKLLLEAMNKVSRNKYKIDNGKVPSPNDLLTGTVEAEITTSHHISTLGSERFKIAQLVVSIIHILSNLALVVGAIKRNGNFVSLWLWLQMVLFIVSVLCCAILSFILFSFGLTEFGAALVTIFLVISCLFGYCYTIVYKFYHELYNPLCSSTKLDANDSAKVAYELQNFPSDKEYV